MALLTKKGLPKAKAQGLVVHAQFEKHGKVQANNRRNLLEKVSEQNFKPKALRVVTLCSGLEAPIQALERLQVPFHHLIACDIEPAVRKVIAKNFAPEQMLGDLTVDYEQIPDHDLLICGFPCQPFSSMGLNLGWQDSRGNVIVYVLKVIQTRMPQYVVLENVKGLTSETHKSFFEGLMGMLRSLQRGSLRYHVSAEVVNSKFFSAPQSRERLYIVAIRSDVLLQPPQWPAAGQPCRDLWGVLDKHDWDQKRLPLSGVARRNCEAMLKAFLAAAMINSELISFLVCLSKMYVSYGAFFL
eukprot:6475829-Amphidinium_carterae.2